MFADLVEYLRPNESWRSQLIESSGLDRKKAFTVIHDAQNFLKHANRDPHEQLSFEESENEELIFIATLDCCELGGPLTTSMQAFQIWYLARNPSKLGPEHQITMKSNSAFQNLTLVLANSLSINTSQTICLGSSGSMVSGDTYGVLPAGISLSGTGYQWSYSTTPGGGGST
ncbi:MAG: hypothetical protein EOO38_23260, partial [Cytophagaceae bacterium]